MIKESLRMIAVILLLIIIVMDDFPFYEKMKNKDTQFFIAIILVLFIYYDTAFGFIMALVVMLMYYEIYKNIKKSLKGVQSRQGTQGAQGAQAVNDQPKDGFANISPACKDGFDYVTEEHLLSAQSNVFDEGNMQMEVRDHGYNGEKFYSTQGLDLDNLIYKGYDRADQAIYA